MSVATFLADNRIVEQLRLWDPVTFAIMTDTPWLDVVVSKGRAHVGQKGDKFEEGLLRKVAGVWCGLAINQNQTNYGKPHLDLNDAGFNCVVPYGEWEGEMCFCGSFAKG